MSASTTSAFDHVSVQKGSGHNMITYGEFWAIPLSERIRLLVEQKIQFLKDGKLISSREALRGGR